LPAAASSGPRGSTLSFRPDPQGKVVLDGIAPGGPFTIKAADRMGGVLAEAGEPAAFGRALRHATLAMLLSKGHGRLVFELRAWTRDSSEGLA
jgi:hypothetical protein